MKQIAFVISFLFILSVGYGQRKIKKVEISEKGFSVKMNYKPIENEITHDGIIYKITPISANDLNELFIAENAYNGKFEYSHLEDSRISYFLEKKKRRREKTDLEFFLEGIDWLIENEKINQQEFYDLEEQIVFYYDEEFGNEVYGLNRVIVSNPYYFDGRYLNVFKLEINNTTNSHKIFDDKIIIENGNKTMNPFTENEIIRSLIEENLLNSDKRLSLKRNHMPQQLPILANSKFEKYFAIPPINYQNNLLLVSFYGFESKFKWNIEKEEVMIDELYTFYEFKVDYDYTGSGLESGTVFNFIVNESTHFIDNDLFYIDEDKLSNEVEVFTISLFSNKLYYGRTSIKGTDLVNIEKNRRKSVNIELQKIDALKKKVKQ